MDNFDINCTYILQLMYNESLLFNTSMMPLTDSQYETLGITRHYLYGIVIPLVCAFGFVGNILNVVIFSRKKNNKVLDEVEYCTTICLVALAVSDMMFCLCTFPNAFMPARNDYVVGTFMLYYKLYSVALINIFILSSTMLTVLTLSLIHI